MAGTSSELHILALQASNVIIQPINQIINHVQCFQLYIRKQSSQIYPCHFSSLVSGENPDGTLWFNAGHRRRTSDNSLAPAIHNQAQTHEWFIDQLDKSYTVFIRSSSRYSPTHTDRSVVELIRDQISRGALYLIVCVEITSEHGLNN